ncbi:hypothetical protein PBI_THONKO_102 [Mycobacterium phage Thonko]|uniref:Uncharacterized protein n=1 Tax=Mycobacterium phage Thonko TaxID=2282910 RepID=A0A346FCE7_9CAUD|nr:hypothetical protein I5G57_gp102 [Mycobacterium phage Thonko]AXN53372.1 hypothetical protein PBI_THONKO_102 [Mycobacterium phage Thonko]
MTRPMWAVLIIGVVALAATLVLAAARPGSRVEFVSGTVLLSSFGLIAAVAIVFGPIA